MHQSRRTLYPTVSPYVGSNDSPKYDTIAVLPFADAPGAPVAAIQKVLNHTDIRTTMIYAAADISAQKVVFNALQAKNDTPKIVNIDEAGCKE